MDAIVLLYLLAIILGVVLNVAVGGWIGSTKGRTGMGQILGFLAGPLGWLIVALLPAIQQTSPTANHSTSRYSSRGKPCPMCSLLVPQGQSICPACKTNIFASETNP